MRIAMISEHASPLAALGGVDAGGQNVHVSALARELGRRGNTVDVYTRREDPLVADRVSLGPGVTVVHVPAGPAAVLPKDELLPFMGDFATWVEQDWRRRGVPDVVHAHFWMSGLAAVQAGRVCGVPVVQTFHALGSVKQRHQGAADTSPPERLDLERDLVRDVDMVIATCSDEVEELARMGGPVDHVRIVPCGVDVTHFHPDGDRPEVERPRLLLAGRLVPRKGFDTAVQALAHLPEAELVIAGGPPLSTLDADPEAQRLAAVAREVGVTDRFTMLGQVPHVEMPSLYRSASVVLATPWYEPFGITPLEAAASGRPLVGSAVGGLLDSVEDGHTGRLVPPRDHLAVADAVRRLLADPATAERWGRNARARAVERFDWSVVAEATEDALREAVQAHSTDAIAVVPTRRDAVVDDDTAASTSPARRWLHQHAGELSTAVASLTGQWPRIDSWGRALADVLVGGGRLLAAGNGGSAAEAQHLTAELVGRFMRDRRPLSAISLHAETSSLTAILNDYGPDEVFARQVEAHGHPGDVLMLLSTSGTSTNVVHAAKRGRDLGLRVWALTGPGPNALTSLAHDVLTVPATSTSVIQEVHLIAVHALCAAVEGRLTPESGARCTGEGCS